jgi:predicted permease
MRILDRLGRRLSALVNRADREHQMDDELAFHLEMEARKEQAHGLSPQDARRAAAVRFGGVESTREACRDARGTRLLEDLGQDVAYGLRSLRRSPGFSFVVVLTLALGIGANSAIFSVVNTVLLKPLPFAHAESLAVLRQSATGAGVDDIGLSALEVQDFRTAAHHLDGVVEYHSMNFTLLGGAEPRRVRAGVVSWDFFSLFGVAPVLGRNFRAEDETHGADAVLLVSHEFWKQELGGDPAAVGRRFEMNDRVHTVIGVLPPLPTYPDTNDVFMPTVACPFRSRPSTAENRQARMVQAFARVKPGVALPAARAEVGVLADRFLGEHPDAYAAAIGYRADLLPLREEMVRQARPTFLLLLGTVGLVLLIACANVANLMVARMAGREKELALRASLGATRGRLLRQLVTESTLLAVAGGLVGLLIAFSASGLLSAFASRLTPRASEIRLDGWVVAFTLVLSVVTGVVSGTLPGLPSWRRLAEALQDGGRGGQGPSRARLRHALVVSQLALSFVLLMGAALTLRSFAKLRAVDAGFRPENVLTAEVHLNWSRYRSEDRRQTVSRSVDFHEALRSRLEGLPGVMAASPAWTFPLNEAFSNNGTFKIEGRDYPEGQALPKAEGRGVGTGYFDAIGVPVLRGRKFDERDRSGAPLVVLINQGLARRYFGDEDPIGRRLSADGGDWATIVGVVGDVRNASLEQEPKDTLYLSFLQFPGFSSQYFVRAKGDPRALERQFREAVSAIDPQTAVNAVRTLEDVRDAALGSKRLTTWLLGAFALLALGITTAGLSGLVAYSVSQRTHEIGIRMALGAAPRRVMRMVLGQGLRSVGLGLVLGTLAALALARLLQGLLFGVAPTDTLCFVASGLLLLATATVACFLPARRAVAIDPQIALRSL